MKKVREDGTAHVKKPPKQNIRRQGGAGGGKAV